MRLLKTSTQATLGLWVPPWACGCRPGPVGAALGPWVPCGTGHEEQRGAGTACGHARSHDLCSSLCLRIAARLTRT